MSEQGQRVTALGELTTVADDDFSYVVDVSDTTDSAQGTSRKVQAKNLRGWPETAAETAASVTPTNYQYEPGNVLRYGATGDGSTDDSTTIQNAINTTQNVYFPDGDYRCANLTASTNFQTFYADGASGVLIRKNANGPIITFSGNNQQCTNLAFRGEDSTPTFTGHNVVSSGAHFSMINCGSRWAVGRAVLATGSHVQIIGTNDIYHTNDATATGYDIEIGVSGTATLYHNLIGVYSSQSTGGIKLIDTGSAFVTGGQFGKLYIAKGTGPAGINGGVTSGCRILGPILVEASTALFIGNQAGSSATLTFAAGTSQCKWDISNSESGGAFSNLGNANNLMVRESSAGSYTIHQYGDDNDTNATIRHNNSSGLLRLSGLELPNNINLSLRNAADDANAVKFNVNASDDFSISNTTSNKTNSYSTTGTASGSRHQFNVNAVAKAVIDNKGIVVGASGNPFISAGSATPESAVTAPIGSIFIRTDGGASTSVYFKESGTGNTGWVGK